MQGKRSISLIHATHPARAVLSCMLAALLALPLASCRDTDVLTEKVIGNINQYEIDYSLAPASVEVDSATSTRSQDEEETDRETDWDYEDPNYGEDATTDGETASQTTGDTIQDSGEATDGTADGERSGVTSLDSEGSEGGLLSYLSGIFGDTEEDSDTEQTTQAEEQTPDTPTSSSADSSGGTTAGTLYATDGNYENIPTDISRIAAAGPYATIVQALGGKNALAAVNQEWLDNLPDEAFSNGTELENTVGISAWGDGTSTNDETIQAIIASGAEALLVSDTYANISQEQADTLTEAGIDVIVMPAIGVLDTPDEYIVETVQVIGQLMKDAEGIGLDSEEMASEWKSLHTQALEETLQRNGGYTVTYTNATAYYTQRYIYQGHANQSLSQDSISYISENRWFCAYVDTWYDASYSVIKEQLDKTENQLVDILWLKSIIPSGYTFDYSLGVAGSALPTGIYEEGESDYALLTYYMQLSGGANRSFSLRPYGNYELLWISAFRKTYGEYLSEKSAVVGDEDFPAVIARSDEIAQLILQSANTYDESSMSVGFYNYGREYQIWVMPAGIDGSWVDGTFESFLAVPWLYCMFRQSSGGSMDYSDSFVDAFYQTFYRCGGGGGIVDDTDPSTAYGGYGTVYVTDDTY